MKPRTKIEKRVEELAQTLPPLTREQENKMMKFLNPIGSDWSCVYATLAQLLLLLPCDMTTLNTRNT